MIRMLPLAVLLVACGPDDDGPDGFETTPSYTTSEGRCDLIEERALAVDENVGLPLNFSAENALGELTGVTNVINVLEWPDTVTTQVHVEFTYTDGDVWYRERDNVGALTQAELSRCFTAIEIEGDMVFFTDDGEFNEAFPATLQAKKRREAVFVVELDPATLGGTWTPETSGLDPAELGTFTLEFDGLIEPKGSEGSITALSENGESNVAVWALPPTTG